MVNKKTVYQSEYILLKDHKDLIGKRARFKNNLPSYCRDLWLKEGVIGQHKGLEHVGLSIFFDKPLRRENGDSTDFDSCYIMPNSFELLDGVNL